MIKKMRAGITGLQRRLFGRLHRIGRFPIWLPRGHRLDTLQELFLHYDKQLPLIAAQVYARYPRLAVIDIGANVGDGLAALRTIGDMKVVCVEGAPVYLNALRRNARFLGGDNIVIPCFVGATSGAIATADVQLEKGTGQIDLANTMEPAPARVRVMTLAEVSAAAGIEALEWLVKIDTDGSDFEIIQGNMDVICRSAVALYFEYDPALARGPNGISTIEQLVDRGFSVLAVFDNFGNFMSKITANQVESFEKLEVYLASCRSGGGGVCYYDVLAMRPDDHETFNSIVSASVQPNLALEQLRRNFNVPRVAQ